MKLLRVFCSAIAAILFFFLTQPAAAAATRVQFGQTSYELEVSKNSIAFSETGFSQKVKRRKCNQTLYLNFIKDFNRNQTNLAVFATPEKLKGAIKVSTEGKTKVAFRSKSEGKYFTSLPSRFKNLWLTSKRLCSQ